MKYIKLSLDEDLLKRIDQIASDLKTTRAAFIRKSIRYYLERLKIEQLEKKHRYGYLNQPVQAGEFDAGEDS